MPPNRAEVVHWSPPGSPRPVPLSARGDHALYVVLRTAVKDIGQFNNLVTIDGLRFER